MMKQVREAVSSAIDDALAHGIEVAATHFEEAHHASSEMHAPTEMDGQTVFLTTIGFAGDVRGTLLLLTTLDVILAMHEPEIRDQITNEAVARDVFGEYANLTLGRVKAQLLKVGIHTMMAVPTTITGKNVQIAPATESFSMWRGFRAEAGGLFVRVDADLASCPEPRPKAIQAVAMDEGELMLF